MYKGTWHNDLYPYPIKFEIELSLGMDMGRECYNLESELIWMDDDDQTEVTDLDVLDALIAIFRGEDIEGLTIEQEPA